MWQIFLLFRPKWRIEIRIDNFSCYSDPYEGWIWVSKICDRFSCYLDPKKSDRFSCGFEPLLQLFLLLRPNEKFRDRFSCGFGPLLYLSLLLRPDEKFSDRFSCAFETLLQLFLLCWTFTLSSSKGSDKFSCYSNPLEQVLIENFVTDFPAIQTKWRKEMRIDKCFLLRRSLCG